MKLYTKNGDSGMTSLINGVTVSKTDERIELLGTLDELSSNIGLAKTVLEDCLKENLSVIQQILMTMMAGIADSRNPDFKIKEEQVQYLENEIDKIETLFPREQKFVLYGECEQSARLDVARAVARRAERRFRKVSVQYGADTKAMQFMNRLSDYLYVLARYEAYKNEEKQTKKPEIEQIVQEILKNMNIK